MYIYLSDTITCDSLTQEQRVFVVKIKKKLLYKKAL